MSFPELSDESDFDFHLKNIKKLLQFSEKLNNISNFPLEKNSFYKRRDKSGWWMVTKQIVLTNYINEYLAILDRDNRSYIKLFYIDPLSSYGMNKVTKSRGRDEFIFPGSSINAALISKDHRKGFSGIYANDLDHEKRKILLKRLNIIAENLKLSSKININNNKSNMDSNKWVIDVLKKIKKNNKLFNYLMIIDNEGMDIFYNTIKKIKDMHTYGDIIITFQDAGIKRNLGNTPNKVKKFFGCEIPEQTPKEKLIEIYMDQLGEIGFGRIEPLKIASNTGFYYTLLFCCRENIDANWLEMIKYYRNNRFKSWTDRDVKNMWDVATGKYKTLF